MVEVNNLTSISTDKKLLQKIARDVFKKENRKLDLSIALVEAKEIQKVNKKYRKKNSPTDVLSFLYDNSGEILICPEYVKKQELKKVLIHGILHLLGYNHGKKMQEKQEYYAKN